MHKITVFVFRNAELKCSFLYYYNQRKSEIMQEKIYITKYASNMR